MTILSLLLLSLLGPGHSLGADPFPYPDLDQSPRAAIEELLIETGWKSAGEVIELSPLQERRLLAEILARETNYSALYYEKFSDDLLVEKARIFLVVRDNDLMTGGELKAATSDQQRQKLVDTIHRALNLDVDDLEAMGGSELLRKGLEAANRINTMARTVTVITNITFDQVHQGMLHELPPTTVSVKDVNNCGSSTEISSEELFEIREESQSYSENHSQKSWSHSGGGTIGFDKLFSISAEYKFDYTTTKGKITSSTSVHTKDIVRTVQVTTPPHSARRIQVVMRNSILDIPYTMTFRTEDGLTHREKGVYRNSRLYATSIQQVDLVCSSTNQVVEPTTPARATFIQCRSDQQQQWGPCQRNDQRGLSLARTVGAGSIIFSVLRTTVH